MLAPRAAALLRTVGLPAVTIVTPIFNEQAVLPELCQRLSRLFDARQEVRWHVVLVNYIVKSPNATRVAAPASTRD